MCSRSLAEVRDKLRNAVNELSGLKLQVDDSDAVRLGSASLFDLLGLHRQGDVLFGDQSDRDAVPDRSVQESRYLVLGEVSFCLLEA